MKRGLDPGELQIWTDELVWYPATPASLRKPGGIFPGQYLNTTIGLIGLDRTVLDMLEDGSAGFEVCSLETPMDAHRNEAKQREFWLKTLERQRHDQTRATEGEPTEPGLGYP